MSDIEGVAQDMLRSFVSRIENIEAEIGELNDDKKEVYAEVRGSGLDPKIVKRVIAHRRKDPNEAENQDLLFDLYMNALTGAA